MHCTKTGPFPRVQLHLAVKPLISRMEKRDKLPVDAELKRRIQELLAYKGGGHNPDLVEEHYIRFLHNGFRETYPFAGNPLRILMRRKS